MHGGLEGGSWGINSGGGLGATSGISLRAQFGRCGGVFEWNYSVIDYVQPDPVSRLNVVGAGVACQIRLGREHNGFWQGSLILVRGLVEYGSNQYQVDDWHSNPVASGTTYGTGFSIGGDLMLPIYFGFYGFGGLGLESIKFHYAIPANTGDIHETSDPTTSLIVRVGVAYGFW